MRDEEAGYRRPASSYSSPCRASFWQTSRREKTCGLPNGHFPAHYEDFIVQPASDLGRAGGLEEQFERLREVVALFLYGISLAGDIEFRAKRDVAVSLTPDDRDA